ncbi:MAG TPA: methylenetetrahydrofolate reductase [Armatimonadota bacterium]|nr:methylenetetrahydrofolate reductase [Armatimonadota bacterium]
MKSGSKLERLLMAGEFVVCGELGPPQSADPEVIRKKCKNFAGYVDAVNLTDNQSAIVRMSSIASAIITLLEGLEPVIQMTCRDRNRIAIQSDILGAAAFGIKNILCLSGDHMSTGNHPQAKPVFDMDAISLISMIKAMRDDKVFQCGEEIKVEPRVFIGGAANPFAEPFEWRTIRLAKKIKAGADFIQTQAVFDVPRFEEFMKAVRERGLHKQVYIIAGVLPARSAKALGYMKDEVPGMRVPEEFLKRMEAAEDPKEEGVTICAELIRQIRDIEGVAGVHIMPVMWESIMPTLVERAGLLPRPEPPPLPESEPDTEAPVGNKAE